MNHALYGFTVRRRRCQIDQRVQHFLHAEIVYCRAEEHRCLFAGKKQYSVKLRRCPRHQFNFTLGLRVLGTEAPGCFGIVETSQNLIVTTGFLLAGAKHPHPVFASVIDAMEQFSHAYGPGEGYNRHSEFAFNLVHHTHWVLHFAVHFIDEGQYGRASGAADL